MVEQKNKGSRGLFLRSDMLYCSEFHEKERMCEKFWMFSSSSHKNDTLIIGCEYSKGLNCNARVSFCCQHFRGKCYFLGLCMCIWNGYMH
jgi:hypothetical protein